MHSFSTEVWLLLLAIGVATVTAILLALAHQFGQERELHDLKHEVKRMREAYRKRLANDANGSNPGDGGVVYAEVVEEENEPEVRQAA